jgi:hypothetical protein
MQNIFFSTITVLLYPKNISNKLHFHFEADLVFFVLHVFLRQKYVVVELSLAGILKEIQGIDRSVLADGILEISRSISRDQ